MRSIDQTRSGAIMHHFLLVISVISLAIAVAAFMGNLKPRAAINLALAPMKTPERLKSYGAEDLTKVAEKLKSVREGANGTMLDLYIRPVLLWNDIIFAVALACFSATLWIWIIIHLELSGAWHHVTMVLAASAVLYGIFDVAEDAMLVRTPGRSGQSERRRPARMPAYAIQDNRDYRFGIRRAGI